jgi:hypothetical protein
MRKTVICEVCGTRKRISSEEEFSNEVQRHQLKCHPKLDLKQVVRPSKERSTMQLGPAQLHLFPAEN